MGSKNVEYLQGKVGNVDVKDCITATNEALKKYSWLNPNKIGLCGGSHGGFLVAHLSGQYPVCSWIACYFYQILNWINILLSIIYKINITINNNLFL